MLVSVENLRFLRVLLVACMGISAALDSRTTLAICSFLLLKSFWKIKGNSVSKPPRNRIALMVVSAVLAFTVAPILFNSVSTSGILGNSVKVKTLSQETVTKNALLAGRPEQSAALALFKKYPFGFGIAVNPSSTDYFIAISNLPVVSGLQANSTVASYFKIDGRYSFHSYLWDFWALYGLVGLALILMYLYRSFCEIIKLKFNSLLLAFASLSAIWSLLFSPPLMHQNLLLFALAISQYEKVNDAKED